MFDNKVGVKKIAYDYDLVSGKVNQVSYQPGLPDAFYHKYVYDAENRITNVLTSADSINWDNDAFYQYYDHGPLTRTVFGEQQVQGVNYAYSLQGWMKTINPDVRTDGGYTLKADGSSGSVVGKPAYNMMLNYFYGDYKAVSGATPMDAGVGGALGNAYRPLYNGNISSMAVNIEKLGNPLLYNYQYDQLNRLVAMDAWKKTGNTWGNLAHQDDLQERVSYDGNGNILSYRRNGNTAGSKPLAMDKLAYSYKPGTNQLDHVYDTVPVGNYDVDIDAQSAGNYEYDSIGNLIKDNAEGITKVGWTVYGKISQIIKGDSVNIAYTYDASGNRISKTVIKSGATDTARTWYVRDAQGNVMSVYESGNSAVNDGHLTQTELHVYGSSRLGLLRRRFDVAEEYNPDDTIMPLLGSGLNCTFDRGNKLFELSNHLGNVLVTVNDKKLGVSSNNSTVDYFNPQVVSAQDYYPFGMLQPGRSFNASGYRYGFNGKENDNEVKGVGNQQDYGMRVYDTRVGRFLSLDPLQTKYPWFTPYQYAGNSPVGNVDLDGLENYNYNLISSKNSKGESVLTIQKGEEEYIGFWATIGRVNTGPVERHLLHYNGKLIAEFSSFNELKQVVHGKTVAQIRNYQSQDIKDAQIVSGYHYAELMRSAMETPSDVNYGRNPVQNQQLLDEAEKEWALEAEAIMKSQAINGILKSLRINSRIKEMTEFKDIQRGNSVKLGQFEAESGALMEDALGVKLRQLKPGEAGDYAIAVGKINGVNVAGKTVDQMGIPKSAIGKFDMKDFEGQIYRHLKLKTGVDFVLIDFRYASTQERASFWE